MLTKNVASISCSVNDILIEKKKLSVDLYCEVHIL